MARRHAPAPSEEPEQAISEPPASLEEGSASIHRLDLSELPIVGLTRRRIGWGLGVVVAVWIVIVFARQVGEASAATTRAAQMQAENATLAAEIEALQHERELIQRPAFIEQQARAYKLGGNREVPFTLAPDAPPLPADAPGSSATRLGAVPETRTPLDAWLDVLFGPTS